MRISESAFVFLSILMYTCFKRICFKFRDLPAWKRPSSVLFLLILWLLVSRKSKLMATMNLWKQI